MGGVSTCSLILLRNFLQTKIPPNGDDFPRLSENFPLKLFEKAEFCQLSSLLKPTTMQLFKLVVSHSRVDPRLEKL